MGRAAAGTPRLLPHRGCPWDPQPTGELLLRGGSPEPPPLSPGERSGLGHRASSQEGTATGHRPHRAAAAAHSKGRAGNKPRPRGGLQAVQCHGHAVVALSLLSAQAGPSRLVREKNILFSPRKALPFHRAPGSCPGNHRPRCGAGSPAQTAGSSVRGWEAALGEGRFGSRGQSLAQFGRSWFRRTGPSPAQPLWSCSSLLPLPSWGLDPSPQLPLGCGHSLGSAQPRAPALCALAAGPLGAEQWQVLQDSPGGKRAPSWHQGCSGGPAQLVLLPHGTGSAPHPAAHPQPCSRGLPQHPAGSLQPGCPQAAAGGQRCTGRARGAEGKGQETEPMGPAAVLSPDAPF